VVNDILFVNESLELKAYNLKGQYIYSNSDQSYVLPNNCQTETTIAVFGIDKSDITIIETKT
jgi:hypothetical protein